MSVIHYHNMIPIWWHRKRRKSGMRLMYGDQLSHEPSDRKFKSRFTFFTLITVLQTSKLNPSDTHKAYLFMINIFFSLSPLACLRTLEVGTWNAFGLAVEQRKTKSRKILSVPRGALMKSPTCLATLNDFWKGGSWFFPLSSCRSPFICHEVARRESFTLFAFQMLKVL